MSRLITYLLAAAAIGVTVFIPIALVAATIYTEGLGMAGQFPSVSAWVYGSGVAGPIAVVAGIIVTVIAAPYWWLWQRIEAPIRRRLGRFSILVGVVGLAGVLLTVAIALQAVVQPGMVTLDVWMGLALFFASIWVVVFHVRAWASRLSGRAT